MYAQINVQLFDQLQSEGYPSADLILIRDAYELAMKVFAGLYRPSGKTFIAHAVGTASVLGSLRASAEIAAAGLLHAAYMYGDFGHGKNGKCDQIRLAVGKEVEEYIARYTAMRWTSKTIPAIYNGFDDLAPADRDVLLIRLANELDDLLDLGILYCSNAEQKRKHHNQFGPMMIEMAETLGFPTLAAELTRVSNETASTEIPAELRSRNSGVILIAPRSYCRRPVAALRQELARARKWVGHVVYRVSRLRHTVSIRTEHQQQKGT